MPTERDKLLQLARESNQESRRLDFKAQFDIESQQAWCEIIKDIVAFVNSGGGVILIGVANDGSSSGSDTTAFRDCDTANITNRIARYTGYQFSDEIEIVEIERAGVRYPAILISEADVPIPFVKPGTYAVPGGKQNSAFSQGTIYFRHGSKSEPGNRDDLTKWRDRMIKHARRNWLSGIRKVVASPPGQTLTIVPESSPLAKIGQIDKVTISTEPGAVRIAPTNPEDIWPHRRKELISRINAMLGPGRRVGTHDIECIKITHNVLNNPRFAFRPHSRSSPQYSEEFAIWIAEQCNKDEGFLEKARAAHKAHSATSS
ncbi:MAG TPA: ATP-binding protein [Stellaceae bacterium]|nr:ATP-binding protein [Stellaceae bacterium]